MLRKPRALLYHDELGAVNDPCTFLDFATHAARHGLHYLAEAHYASMPFEHVPAPIRDTLAELDLDFLRRQQFMDVIFQRWLRSSLLCLAEPPPERTPDSRAIRDCALGLRLRPASASVNLQPGLPMRMLGPNELALDFDQSQTKAFLSALAQAAPARVPFREALENANRYLSRVGLPAVTDEAALCDEMCRLFTIDALDLVLGGNGEWLRTGAPPRPSALMRYQARCDFPQANRWHELIDLTTEGRRALADPSQSVNETALLLAGLLA